MGKTDIVLYCIEKKVAIFDWEWGRNLAPREGQKIPWCICIRMQPVSNKFYNPLPFNFLSFSNCVHALRIPFDYWPLTLYSMIIAFRRL